MREKLDGRRHVDNVESVPAFAICPPARCSRQVGPDQAQVCGELATHLIRGKWWFEDRAFCTHCAPAGAMLLPPDISVRRVHMRLEVYIAGTSGNAPTAQREALERVRHALEDAGALVELLEIRSTFGRYAPLPVQDATKSDGEAR